SAEEREVGGGREAGEGSGGVHGWGVAGRERGEGGADAVGLGEPGRGVAEAAEEVSGVLAERRVGRRQALREPGHGGRGMAAAEAVAGDGERAGRLQRGGEVGGEEGVEGGERARLAEGVEELAEHGGVVFALQRVDEAERRGRVGRLA